MINKEAQASELCMHVTKIANYLINFAAWFLSFYIQF